MLKLFARLFDHSDVEDGEKPVRIDRPPPGAVMRAIRSRGSEPVEAVLAGDDGTIEAAAGALHYRAGRHYIVAYANGDRAPVEKRIFELMYRARDDGRYEKRTDVVLHYFTLSYPVIVETLEGDRLAAPGDWIVSGVVGELYPVPRDSAEQKYQAA